MKKIKINNINSYVIIILFWLIIIGATFSLALYLQKRNQTNTINILAWGGVFDTKTLSDFEKENGIKINISYYTTNEELLVNLKATRAKGYDLIVPSDYAVKLLKENNLLKKIDKTKLNFLDKINPLFLNHFFDPENSYSVPYIWEILGIGINEDLFKKPSENASWSWIFTNPKNYKIIMVNDPIEAVFMATFYLYKSKDPLFPNIPEKLNDQQIQKIKEILINQRNWIEAYTNFRPDYFLLTENCPLVVTDVSNTLRGMRQSSKIKFIIPNEGAFLSIENLAIPINCLKEDMIYKFLNYLYKKDVMKNNYETYSSLPVTKEVLSEINLIKELKQVINLSKEAFKKRFFFLSPLMSEKKLQNLWVDIKSY